MRILKLILYILLGVVLAWFAARNWYPVPVRLWPPYELVIRLPVLLLIAVLAGALPGAIVHSASRMRWRRRLARSERELARAREENAPPLAEPQPTVVPPQGA